ncbi:hypothetical protein ACVW0J_000661 [Bradyrhizobium sp. i1.7.7]
MMKSPGLHRGALAVDRGVSALAFEHEAQRRLAVAVCGRDVAGHHHLHAGIERGRDFRLAAQAGVLQHQHAPLGFLGRDQSACFRHVVADDVEFPQMRPAGAPRLRRDQIAHHRPQRGEVFAVNLLVEGLAFRRLGHGFHGAAPVRFVD